MKVHLIAATVVDLAEVEEAVSSYEVLIGDREVITSPDALAEFAGRACYQSWSRPNPKTAGNKDYLENVISQGHESVLAHASATFYVTGVSRSLTHELIRHRWLAFSELSQRYVDMKDSGYAVPPAITDKYDLMDLEQTFEEAVEYYEAFVSRLERQGLSRKKAREAARAVLPGMTETKIVVSGNLRAWRDFLKQRLSPHADAEICQLAREIYKHLTAIAPNSMYGIKDFEEN